MLVVAAMLLAATSARAQTTYPFSNSDPAPHNSWNTNNSWASALSRSISVGAVPTSGMVLRQVVLDLGSSTGSNVSTLTGRLTDPAGNTVTLFAPGYFYDTDFSRFVNITFRDHPVLKRLSDYTNSYLGMPYSFGYYRTEAANAYQAFNTTTDVNGAWVFEMIENTGTEIQFNSVELVFGPPFTYIDITGATANNLCAEAQCLQSGAGEITLGTNVNYSQNQANFPSLNLNGCNWNAEPNNTSWFRFTASASNVDLSISGFTNLPQQTIVLRNTGTCNAPAYSMVGCPWTMFASGCGTTTGNPTLYHRVCYDGGIKFNHGYSLTGLTVGEEYFLIVDGQAGANTTFYMEITTGAEDGCQSPPIEPEITEVLLEAPGCDGNDGTITVVATGTDPLEYSIDDGQTWQLDPAFTGLAGGSYNIVVRDPNGLTDTSSVTLVGPVLPLINGVDTTPPTCGEENGSIIIDASGNDPVQYSIDNGASFQVSSTFVDLAAGSYTVVVLSDGCPAIQLVTLDALDAPVIDQLVVDSPLCAGDSNGSITVEASGGAGLEFSIDGGAIYQSTGIFTGLIAGDYTVVVRDQAGCTVTRIATLTEPAAVVLVGVEVEGESCAGSCDGSLLVDAQGVDLYSINGGQTQSTGLFLGLCPGTYDLVVSSTAGCSVGQQLVIDEGTLVQAAFTADPMIITEPGTSVEFTNSSVGASTYAWDFAALGSSSDENPSFMFPVDEGTLQVCLVATSDNGCSDTTCVVLNFEELPSDVSVPTVYSPNGDGVNDTFGIIGDPGKVSAFSLLVYNRWGQLLFDGKNKAQVWDGRQGSGEVCPEGTYYWVLDYTTEAGLQIERTGHVTLLR